MLRIPPPYRVLRRLRRLVGRHEDTFLAEARGVLHVGANAGQEREDYARHALPVVWFEPIPELFETLRENIAAHPAQSAIQALVTDEHGKVYRFNVASNNGASSSILELGEHRTMWPDVSYTRTLSLTATTLDRLLEDGAIEGGAHDSLVLDTQGSELMVLKGAETLLESIRFVKTEAADFAAYEGCCTANDLREHLGARGFRQTFAEKFAQRRGVGAYHTLVFSR